MADSKTVTIRTRKFTTNRLLPRKQFMCEIKGSKQASKQVRLALQGHSKRAAVKHESAGLFISEVQGAVVRQACSSKGCTISEELCCPATAEEFQFKVQGPAAPNQSSKEGWNCIQFS